MHLQTFARGAGALLILATTIEAHKGTHDQLNLIHRRHREQKQRELNETIVEHSGRHELRKRGQCAFPTGAGLIAVTPGSANGGWAMSPDQPCRPGSYCPYACPSGQVSVQWDPKATSYSYPQSMVRNLRGMGVLLLTRCRTVDYTATVMGKFPSRSQISHIVSQLQQTLVLPTMLEASSLFARRFCQETRPC